MVAEKRIDDLIEAGWNVLESDFDPRAFQVWRNRAFDCLTMLLGSKHTYTLRFANYVRQPESMDTLAGEGILSAAKEQICRARWYEAAML
ncbi:MAG: hypothetical protein P8182_08540 [Deltaproteobacteria bacterium]